jgi:hypothetical protein
VSPVAVHAGPWRRALAERGFVARGATWTRAGLQAAFVRSWLVLRAPAGDGALDPLASDARWPGPWRLVPHGAGLARLLELPPTVVGEVEGSPEGDATALATLDWALALAEGDGEALDSPPPLEPAERESQWVVRSGALAARVRPLHGDARAGLELPLSARPLAGLEAERLLWVRALLLDARARWRLVRCLAEGPSARVDLRGAPPALVEGLAAAALDALRQLGAWLLEPLDLVLDPAVGSRSPRARPAPGRPLPRARPAPPGGPGPPFPRRTVMVRSTLPVRERPESLQFLARTVTATKTLPVEVEPELPAEAVARAVAELLSMPADTPWALREDDTAAFLDGDRPIGEQIQSGARITLTPKAILGGAR